MSRPTVTPMNRADEAEITFIVSVDELDCGYSASALEYGIHTQGDTLDELHYNMTEAVECHFDDGQVLPRIQVAGDIPS